MQRKRLLLTGVIAGFAGVILIYANWPTAALPLDAKVDSVLVLKGERKLILLQGDRKIKEYSIALGRNPNGKKIMEGDERTPEGRCKLDYRNPNSVAHLSIHISYPDQNDISQARAKGVAPGGAVMIHGLPKGFGFLGRLQRLWDWTDGCIGVTNPEIEEIWRYVPDGAPIEIKP
ncbi:MAG: L,D-transpeptidase family protein [Chloracidobacterium sp.]|nr:L,D-transpeptidase family protein [Chloracidobacterium sp.]